MSEHSEPLLRIDTLVKHFPVRGGVMRRRVGTVHAVNGVSFEIARGETLALVGESGSGKSTTGRTLIGFQPATSGSVFFEGVDLSTVNGRERRALRRRMQYVFQDPYASLNARMTVGEIIGEPLQIHKMGDRRQRKARAQELMDLVGLDPAMYSRYPHQFSGGQRQRIGVARALALEPDLLILDEPVSALDLSVQAQVINLLTRLQREMNLAYLFIAHDLAAVRQLADRVAVMYMGEIVEYGDADTVYDHPSHPYTKALLSAIPLPDPRLKDRPGRQLLSGDLPSPLIAPSGCAFTSRCWLSQDRCEEHPELIVRTESGAQSACHFAEEVAIIGSHKNLT